MTVGAGSRDLGRLLYGGEPRLLKLITNNLSVKGTSGWNNFKFGPALYRYLIACAPLVSYQI